MKRPVILGLVSYRVFPPQMGGQKHIAAFYQELAAQTTVVVAAARQNSNTGTSFPVFSFLYDHWKGLVNMVYLPRLSGMVKKYRVDVLLAEHSYFGFLGILLRRITGKPFVIRSQNIEAHRFRDLGRWWWWCYERYERWVHRKADHSFFITEEDRDWALQQWRLAAEKCSVSTYGCAVPAVTATDRMNARAALLKQHGLPQNTRLFLFNGTLDYLPNTDALRIILTELLPLLRQRGLLFRVIVCGRGLEEQWRKELASHPEIIYKGFVPDINPYFTGADCLVNPITLGGGIRTKTIEALAHNQTVISTQSSAHGINRELTDGKLVVVPDYQWPAFAEAMAGDLLLHQEVPAAFRDAHNWHNIVRDALLSLQTL